MEREKNMEKIRNVIIKIKEDTYTRILIELIIGTLLFNVNNVIGIMFVALMVIEIIFSNTENSLYIYIFLSFFDEVLQNKYLGGSISRIFMVVIAIKLLFHLL